MGRIDVVVLTVVAVVHHVSWAAARLCLSIHQMMAAAGPVLGRGPARPVTFSNFHGPDRPIHFSKFSARSRPSRFDNTRPGPAHHIFQIGPARTTGP